MDNSDLNRAGQGSNSQNMGKKVGRNNEKVHGEDQNMQSYSMQAASTGNQGGSSFSKNYNIMRKTEPNNDLITPPNNLSSYVYNSGRVAVHKSPHMDK
jgi:hypothetical protein